MSGPKAPDASGNKTPYLGLHSFKVYVRDQERSVRFYCDQLGFRLAFDARLQSGERWVAVAPPDGTAVLTLIQPAPDSTDFQLIGRASRAVFVTEDVFAKVAEWTARGVTFRSIPRLRRIKYEQRATGSQPSAQPAPVWGQITVRFEDVDRNTFTLVSFDEVTRALEAERRATHERLESERRTAQELEYATQVQAGLFPQTLPPACTLDYAGICVQARRVGGDYYDFLNLGGGRLGLIVGDIAGKGMAAALLMANLQANLRSGCAIAVEQPEAFFNSLNGRFFENTPAGAYATLFFAEYREQEGQMRYVNCGHLPGLIVRGDHVERLSSTCTVLGLFEEWDCEVSECRLEHGDTLVLYTDGITEACNSEDEEFGEHGLLQAVRSHSSLAAKEMVGAIVKDVCRFSPHEQQDDMTLIVAKCARS